MSDAVFCLWLCLILKIQLIQLTGVAVLVEMNSSSASGGGAVGAAAGMMGITRSPFTVSQWQELEHQALIFKYMVAGLPVPPDLVLPIQKSFESISQRFFHHSTSKFSNPLSFSLPKSFWTLDVFPGFICLDMNNSFVLVVFTHSFMFKIKVFCLSFFS